MELLMVVNEDRFFLSHRLDIALEVLRRGGSVTVYACDTGRAGEIRRYGIGFVPLPQAPARIDLPGSGSVIRVLTAAYRHHRAAVVHHVGMKMILLGGIAARMARHRRIVNAVSGLGSLFSGRHRLQLPAVIALRYIYRGFGGYTIFQNRDDEAYFVGRRIPTGHRVYIKGSGIDCRNVTPKDYVDGEPECDNSSTAVVNADADTNARRMLRVIYTGRMIREKGVEDFCAAAEMLRPEFEGRVEWVMYGALSRNPSALSVSEISRLTDGCYIRWGGEVSDVVSVLRQSDIFLFPSYYREGLPKSLIEASAVGLPIVTTDSVGCRDTVTDGENGFIVPPRRPDVMAARVRELLENRNLRRSMGARSRQRAASDYDLRDVVAEHMRIYLSL